MTVTPSPNGQLRLGDLGRHDDDMTLNAGITIRQRDERDADALLQMFNQPRCRLGMVLEPFSSVREVQAWFDSYDIDKIELVAAKGDAAIGYAGLFPGRGRQSHVGSISLFLHDEFHGRGIGTLLMIAIIATADILVRLRRIQLVVFSDNERAISLYRKFGFEIDGFHECFARRGDDFVDAFSMARLARKGSSKGSNVEELWRDLRNLISLYKPHAFPGQPDFAMTFAGERD
jgi:L-phenylalanine/L-methionine N-acetyltransferase